MKRKTLKSLVREADLTFQELADKLGVNQSMISQWNSQSANPKLDTMIKLAKELKVSLKVLAHAMGRDTEGIPDDLEGGENNRSQDSI